MEPPVTIREVHDVVVVGAGGSGLAAAASASEHGAGVLVLEKRPRVGGTTGIAVGSFTASGTEHQRRAGIADTAAAHDEDAGQFAPAGIEARNSAELRQYFLEHFAQTLRWLQGMGLAFHGPNPEPPNRVARMHNVVPGARAYIIALERQIHRHGGHIRCDTTVEELIRDSGRVAGVRGRDGAGKRRFEIRARRGVVLAGGDYAANGELIARYKGEDFAAIDGINPDALGEGHHLAESVGARLVNMDVTYGPELRFVPPERMGLVQRLATHPALSRFAGRLLPIVPRVLINTIARRLLVTWQHPENALLEDGALLVNARGERFCNELESPGREIELARQPGKIGYLVLDGRLVQRYGAWPHFISTAPEIAYAYVDDYVRLRPDVAVRGRSLEELAARRRLPLAALGETVQRYNRHALDATPDPHGRGGVRHPLEGGPWALLGPARAYFTTTEGGAAIDRQLRVLDHAGTPIEGLFAVGQNGLGGQILWGHGLHIGWAITSGRLAGRILADVD